METSKKHKTPNAPKSLVVKFHEIPQGGLEFHFSSDSHSLDDVLKDLFGTRPTYDIDLKVDQAESMATVSGTLKGELPLTCSRCAEDFTTSLAKKFSTIYYKSEERIKTLPGGNVSDLESNLDLEHLEGNEIDLGEVVHEQVALEIPFQPLCKEECKGLCTQCGTNLNEDLCQCSKLTNDLSSSKKESPFAKLKEWKN